MKDKLRQTLSELMMLPGLSGHEDRVRRAIKGRLDAAGIASRTDRLGNLIATVEGDPEAPSVMLFAHTDQLGFITRKIEPNGLVRVERLGGIPEKALPAQAVLFCVGEGRDVHGVVANKSHHATPADEKYKVTPYQDLFIDVGTDSAEATRALGIEIGTPVVYQPRVIHLNEDRVAGTSVDDRAGCAVVLQAALELQGAPGLPTVHYVFAVLEEFNLRGAMVAAQSLQPDIAVQLDLALTSDTPDMAHRGEVAMGAGPAMALYSFHGRGTLNGTIPHPALTRLFETTASEDGLPLQRTAHVGALTDSSYVQLVGEGVAVVDLCFPSRYTHTALELCDLRDLEGLTRLVCGGIRRMGRGFELNRDLYT
ncbi:M20/M25/M40 family metallo-hydrolase [Aureimonas sp. OT7]|uniref:M42 family metallopeptidase n=1 Tax=Aureimonas sp. OT7 TaxID=2816454 RepID=UPI0017827C7F|nr:M20/M25/M40 family metallo-hydrolase [Aureimonas sp. OT7]QOG05580.1 M20/M25/M40 family metallo-hydrolase [Aureimonas sp. OT7]